MKKNLTHLRRRAKFGNQQSERKKRDLTQSSLRKRAEIAEKMRKPKSTAGMAVPQEASRVRIGACGGLGGWA